ncbi:MAG: stringent starvation protein B [Pseudohongiellaceae bacterium]|jgi:stringent starvation protein B
MTMSSSRPYLVRALYDWILENNCTPYILVNAIDDNVQVPLEHVKDGQIILNVSPSAVQALMIQDQALEFEGRFAGISKVVYVPMRAVMGIYAKENGQGMIFDAEGSLPKPPNPTGTDPSEKAKGISGKDKPSSSESAKPTLRLVK